MLNKIREEFELSSIDDNNTASKLMNAEIKDYDELEQAYKELKDCKEWWRNRFNAVQRDYEDYKSRIEKAIEKLKKIQQNAIKYGAEHDAVVCQELIDGLNGRSDE